MKAVGKKKLVTSFFYWSKNKRTEMRNSTNCSISVNLNWDAISE